MPDFAARRIDRSRVSLFDREDQEDNGPPRGKELVHATQKAGGEALYCCPNIAGDGHRY